MKSTSKIITNVLKKINLFSQAKNTGNLENTKKRVLSTDHFSSVKIIFDRDLEWPYENKKLLSLLLLNMEKEKIRRVSTSSSTLSSAKLPSFPETNTSQLTILTCLSLRCYLSYKESQ